MQSVDQRISESFRRFEVQTRGWQVHPHPAAIEPPYVPFALVNAAVSDDGRRPTFLSSLFSRVFDSRPRPEPSHGEVEGSAAQPFERGSLVEIPLPMPSAKDAGWERYAAFIESLSLCDEPVAFELLATSQRITAQLAASSADEWQLRQQLRAFFPEIPRATSAESLETAWDNARQFGATVELGLGREGLFSLAEPPDDSCTLLLGALGGLRTGEMAVYQVLFHVAQNPWAEGLLGAILTPEGRPLFQNAPAFLPAAKAKLAHPLFAAVVRVAARAGSEERLSEVLRMMCAPLSAFSNAGGNELIPLRNDAYPPDEHAVDLVLRQSRRSGMVINVRELAGLIRFPSSAIIEPRLFRQIGHTKAAPEIVTTGSGVVLGVNDHHGERRMVRLSEEQRTRHVHLIGASGTGKSTLLFQMIRQDIENGQGVGVFDPHGDLIDRILGIIPPNRIDDVVLLDPADDEYVVGLNLLAAHGESEKSLLAQDLVSVFRRLSTSWGDQMGSVLGNAILAFVESKRGGTLIDLRRFLLEPPFREQFLATVDDPDVTYYWRHGFKELTGGKSIGPVLTRLETFLAPKAIRLMVAHDENRLDVASILNTGKIFLAKLCRGTFGRENSQMLGSLLISKIHQAALARQRLPEGSRKAFWLYVDEFPDFMTPSMAEILAGARKYRVGLVLAHQDLRQLERDPDVASAVLSNAYTRVCFRLGDADARELRHGFSAFGADELQALGTGEAICRVERGSFDFNLKVLPPEYPAEADATTRRHVVIETSRAAYGTQREVVELAMRARIGTGPEPRRPQSTVALPAEPAVPVPAPAFSDCIPAAPALPSSPPERNAAAPLPQKRPTDPGRGGAQHKAVQKRLKEAAEAAGFRVSVEQPVLEGTGSVDLLLERLDSVIACEVTVTTTVDHEVGNIAKCRSAGFSKIAVVAVESDKLSRIAEAARVSLGEEAMKGVAFFLPDDFIAFLRAMPTPAPKERTTLGRKVRLTSQKLDEGERSAREARLIETLVSAMRRGRERTTPNHGDA